jgi:lipid A 3-O-deacylase
MKVPIRIGLGVVALTAASACSAWAQMGVSLFWENDQKHWWSPGPPLSLPPPPNASPPPGVPPPGANAPSVGAAGSDQYYTNGLKVSFLFPDGPLAGFPGLSNYRDDDKAALTTGFVVGQSLYTPANIKIPAFIPDDRPYGAWLYIGATAEVAKGGWSQTFEVDVGCTGRCALGGPTQTGVHRFIRAPLPQGWDHQIGGRVGAVASYRAKRRWVVWSGHADVIPRLSGTLSNIFTWAGTGATARVSFGLLDDFGPGDMPGSTDFPGQQRSGGGRGIKSSYGFVSFEGRLVGHNVFLDASPSLVEKNRVVRDLEAGIALRVSPHFSVIWRRVWRSREFQGQPDRFRFGSFNFTFIKGD